MSRFALALVAALGASSLVFAACSGSSSTSGVSTSGAPGSGTAASGASSASTPAAPGTKPATQGAKANAGIDACKLLTKAEVDAAAAAVSNGPEPGRSSTTGAGASQIQYSICNWKDSSGAFLAQVTWTKTKDAQANFDSLRKLAGNAADEVPGSATRPITPRLPSISSRATLSSPFR